jgi:hypothetical protein
MRSRVDPVERGIQFLKADPAAPGRLIRQVRRMCRAILKVGKIIDVDQHLPRDEPPIAVKPEPGSCRWS